MPPNFPQYNNGVAVRFDALDPHRNLSRHLHIAGLQFPRDQHLFLPVAVAGRVSHLLGRRHGRLCDWGNGFGNCLSDDEYRVDDSDDF